MRASHHVLSPVLRFRKVGLIAPFGMHLERGFRLVPARFADAIFVAGALRIILPIGDIPGLDQRSADDASIASGARHSTLQNMRIARLEYFQPMGFTLVFGEMLYRLFRGGPHTVH